MGRAFINREGVRYGRLTATRFLGVPSGKSKPHWLCGCDCGQQTSVSSSNLATGHVTSCGCFRTEALEARRKYSTEDAAEYQVWRGIKQRTSNSPGKNSKWYANVTLCDLWENSFSAFLSDMGPRPSSSHSIERRDPSKGYSPENCYWATPTEQANNRSSNTLLTCEGTTKTLAQWAQASLLPYTTIAARIRRGWDAKSALTLPLHTRFKNVPE